MNLKDKTTLIIAAAIVFLITSISYINYQVAKQAMTDLLQKDLRHIAVSLARQIDPSEVKKVLAGNDKAAAYWDLKRKLNAFTLIGEDRISEAYILVPTGKKDIWEFVADGQMKDKKKMAVLRQAYDISRFDEMKKGLYRTAVDKEITHDRWGSWLSAYAPVFDRYAKPFAVFGIDMKAENVNKLRVGLLHLALTYLLIGIFAALLLGWMVANSLVNPILALAQAANKIEQGEYGIKVEFDSQDEMGELVQAFNDMSAKLSEVDRMKSSFLSVISHELYTPLTPILSGADAIKMNKNLPEECVQIAEMIERQAFRMRNLVDEMLDFSWLEISNLNLKKEPVNITQVIEEAVDQRRKTIRQKTLDFRMQIDDLPVITADKNRLIHVFKILIDNGIKFSAEMGKIEISGKKSAQGIEIVVSDNGIGIAPENLRRIFNRFYQAEDFLTRSHGGVGLGLAIAERIIEAHGGTIKAESEGLGKGSRFIVNLPLEQPA
jgi:signal transduction histidine kinase